MMIDDLVRYVPKPEICEFARDRWLRQAIH